VEIVAVSQAGGNGFGKGVGKEAGKEAVKAARGSHGSQLENVC